MSLSKRTYNFRNRKGAQTHAFHDYDNQGSKFILSKCIPNGNGSKKYIAMSDEISCFELFSDHHRSQQCFSEMIIKDSPSRVHFDADLKHKTKDGERAYEGNILSNCKFLEAVCQFIIKFMKDYYDITVNLTDLHITNACTYEKLSFHI
jgi:hypothetical protein